MIKRNKVLLLLFFPLILSAQSPEEDEVRFQSAMDWLDSKLNYIYYDGAGAQWWNNTFYVNEKKEITIKHIASDRPNTANIKDKTYTIRKFRIQDINPNSLKITEIKESRGRIVKGQMLELRTYGFQDLIHKSINNRKASSTSFLFLSFPETLIDSLSSYAEIVKSKLEEAIWASNQVYTTNHEDDIKKVLSVLTGTYQSIEGSIWNTVKVQPNVLKLEREKGKIEYFGYDTTKKLFYLLSISEKGIVEKNYRLNEEIKLKLYDEESQESILIETPNSFNFNGLTFFRQ